MKTTNIALLLMVVLFIFTCKQTMQLTPSRAMHLSPNEVTSYHEQVTLKVGWVPYQEDKLVMTGENEWKIVKHTEEDASGFVPMILLMSPNSTDSIWLDMEIDNELLGKLVKHSIITQEPIQRPFSEYFEVAKCSNCHPSHIKIDFE